jgi:hypothetical protein
MAGTRYMLGPAEPDPSAGHDAVNGELAGNRQPSPIPLKALLIQEPVFSLGSKPPVFTSV